jgi:hypothetical protein
MSAEFDSDGARVYRLIWFSHPDNHLAVAHKYFTVTLA